jgi:uncharacterized protein (TIGR00730 family)
MNHNPPADKLQTLSEDQYMMIQKITQEYEAGMLALAQLDQHSLTVYGGTLVEASHPSYKDIHSVCKQLATKGWNIVSGGGPGMMTASLQGAIDGGGKAIAFCIDIPGEPPFEGAYISLPFTQFSVRKYMLRQSDAIIIAPGGYGTLDEMMELLTLIKVGKLPKKPVFLYDSSFWNGYVDWLQNILLDDRGVIDQTAINLFHIVDSGQEILKILHK